MIELKEIESLRHTEYNSDPVVMEMLDTIEALFKENAELKLQAKPSEEPSLDTWESEGGCSGCGCDDEVGC